MCIFPVDTGYVCLSVTTSLSQEANDMASFMVLPQEENNTWHHVFREEGTMNWGRTPTSGVSFDVQLRLMLSFDRCHYFQGLWNTSAHIYAFKFLLPARHSADFYIIAFDCFIFFTATMVLFIFIVIFSFSSSLHQFFFQYIGLHFRLYSLMCASKIFEMLY